MNPRCAFDRESRMKAPAVFSISILLGLWPSAVLAAADTHTTIDVAAWNINGSKPIGGEKVALNGGLNCSILDGWWAEMFDGENGWAIAASEATDPEIRDPEDSAAVIDTLVAARDEYYQSRDVFNRRIRHAWRTLGPRVTAARMLRDYQTRLYDPVLSTTR